MAKEDIKNRADIDQLMRYFYDKLLEDSEMDIIFNKVMTMDFTHHFSILVDFWDNVLFYTGAYKNNAMEKHFELNDKYPLTKQHFDTWLGLFHLSVDELFEGEKATLAKSRATSIAAIMQIKMGAN